MEIGEKLVKLRKKHKLNQSEFAVKIGVTQKTVSFWEQNKNIPDENNIVTICNIFNLPNTYFNTEVINITNKSEETIAVDYYPDVLASCGNGAYELSQNCIKYDVPATLFPPSQNVKGYSMCHAKGNSMYPRIWDGDFVICEHKDDMKIENGEMYIFCFDDQIYLKRLTKNINQIVVESENPDFPTQYIEKEQMNDVHLIGHVICSGRMNGKYLDKRV